MNSGSQIGSLTSTGLEFKEGCEDLRVVFSIDAIERVGLESGLGDQVSIDEGTNLLLE